MIRCLSKLVVFPNLLKTLNQSMLDLKLDLFGRRAWEHVYINVLCHVDVLGLDRR